MRQDYSPNKSYIPGGNVLNEIGQSVNERARNARKLGRLGYGKSLINSGVIEAYNKTGSPLPTDRNSIVGLSVPSVLPANNASEFVEKLYRDVGLPEDCRKIGVAIEPANDGGPILVTVVGAVRIRVDVYNAHLGTAWKCLADVIVGNIFKMKSSTTKGASVTWIESQDANGNPTTAGEQWAEVTLPCGGVEGSSEVNCDSIADVYGMPNDPGPQELVGIVGDNRVCAYAPIVLCGNDTPIPCVGCTGGTNAYNKLRMAGVTLVDPVGPDGEPPTNAFDIPSGSELVLFRSDTCYWDGTISYHEPGDIASDPGVPMTVQLIYDDVEAEWYVKLTSGANSWFWTKATGSHDCTSSHVYSYSAADSDDLPPGYDFGGSTITIVPVVLSVL